MNAIKTHLSWIAIAFSLLISSVNAYAQYGYTITTGEAIWGSDRESRDLSLTNNGAITNGGEAFLLESLLPQNPINNTDQYVYDYKIKSFVITPIYTGDVVYYVSSKDGSIAFTGEENPALQSHLGDRYGTLHFGIRKANGNFLLCGWYKNEQTGTMEKRGIDLGKNMDLKTIFSTQIWEQAQWLNSARPFTEEDLINGLTPYQAEIIQSSAIEAKTGKVPDSDGTGDQIINFYLIPYPVMERISTLFMGVNVGIMKNFNQRINQLVIYSVVRDVEWKGSTTNLQFFLEGLYQADATFRPADYKVVTAFNKKGNRDGQALQQELMVKAQRLAQLKRLMDECPKGNAGKECREPYKREYKEIEIAIEQKTKAFMQEHGLE